MAIDLVVVSTVTPGKLDELRTLIVQVSEHCRATEPGLERYDWFVDDDGARVRVLERYTDAEALAFHTTNYADFLPALAECRTLESLTVFGDVDDAFRAVLAERGATVCAPLALGS